MEPVTVQHDTADEALLAVQRALQEAAEDGKWMVAVWSVVGDQLRLLTRTTWQFPVGDVEGALAQVRQSMTVLQPAPQTLSVKPMEPLPIAAAFAPKPAEAPPEFVERMLRASQSQVSTLEGGVDEDGNPEELPNDDD